MGYAVARMLCAYAQNEACSCCSTPSAATSHDGEGYARATIGAPRVSTPDAVTVNPYMGKDTLELHHPRAGERHGLSPCSCARRTPAQAISRICKSAARRCGGGWRNCCARMRAAARASGWSGLMAVAGATYPEEARAVARSDAGCAVSWGPAMARRARAQRDAVAGFAPGTAGREGGVVSSSRACFIPGGAERRT